MSLVAGLKAYRFSVQVWHPRVQAFRILLDGALGIESRSGCCQAARRSYR